MLFQKILFAVSLCISFVFFNQIGLSNHFKRKWGSVSQLFYFLLISLGAFVVFFYVVEKLLKTPLSIATVLEGILVGAVFAIFLNLKNR